MKDSSPGTHGGEQSCFWNQLPAVALLASKKSGNAAESMRRHFVMAEGLCLFRLMAFWIILTL
jgi:hypothetical protein